ncbi:hypothetical protein F5887DRAFT_94410 [Amanita rubescens]|nr:hypothetical protein F5887DRAFT_94410 [Amanita rubescens]
MFGNQGHPLNISFCGLSFMCSAPSKLTTSTWRILLETRNSYRWKTADIQMDLREYRGKMPILTSFKILCSWVIKHDFDAFEIAPRLTHLSAWRWREMRSLVWQLFVLSHPSSSSRSSPLCHTLMDRSTLLGTPTSNRPYLWMPLWLSDVQRSAVSFVPECHDVMLRRLSFRQRTHLAACQSAASREIGYDGHDISITQTIWMVPDSRRSHSKNQTRTDPVRAMDCGYRCCDIVKFTLLVNLVPRCVGPVPGRRQNF